MIMDCEDLAVFTNAMELHYIDMKAYTKAVNDAGGISIGDVADAKFATWMSVITQKDAALSEKDTVIAEKDAEIERLRAMLEGTPKQGDDISAT